MKLNHNQARSYRVPPKAVALISALAIASGGIGAAEAGANTSGGFGAPEVAGNTGGIEGPQPAFRARRRGKTPLRVLTGIITRLENGKQARVTAQKVEIPGPIGKAEGQPLVFKEGGRTYFAYRQESQPDFQLAPAETASSMAITQGRNVPTESAHLDKAGELIDASEHAVGFSIGGDSGGK